MKRRAAKLVSVSRNRRSGECRIQTSVQDIGARLALTRRALILTRFQMARLIGIDVPTWGTYEAGLERIPPDEALKLAPYGISLNWIYGGRTENLHPHIRAKIRELQREPVKR